ncbi:putative quinol monooxygenase [Pontibacter sp. MBLB2868]|uniref:putative quinol monooxygenase n=1 Tax=Pontibacter sp. MBLB2868 TaxID=3451555 RepID=UPI003F7501F1
MVSKGLLVRLEVKSGKDAEVETFFRSALPMIQQEVNTIAWFAIRFGKSEYGIFDVFETEEAREEHLQGSVAKILTQQINTLFSEPPKIQRLDVFARKLPTTVTPQPDTKAVLLTFKAKEGHNQEVERFLAEAEALARNEPDTTAWFAIKLDNNEYGIFDVFPDNGGRFKHLTGQIPRELAKHALSLLGSMPDMELPTVLQEKLPIH